MALLTTSSPHAHQKITTAEVMYQVILATIPGVLALTIFFGWGTVINIAIAALVAIASEACILNARNKPVLFYLKDNSALVTGILLAIAIPPFAPWWVTLIGTSFAIVVAKQLYGGLGFNPFNPAMCGYVLLLISFPVEMTAWAPDIWVQRGGTDIALDFTDSFSAIWTGLINGQTIDAYTMATPLDNLRTYAGDVSKLESLGVSSLFFPTHAWAWVNIAFLCGGLYLVHKGIVKWHIPLSFLAGLGLAASIFAVYDVENFGSPLFHLLSGGAMLGAFFIATDPVSAPTSQKGRILHGLGIGVLVYIIRTWGGYPDAIAFAVLLFNLAAPTIDYYTKPRTYGHSHPLKRSAQQGEP